MTSLQHPSSSYKADRKADPLYRGMNLRLREIGNFVNNRLRTKPGSKICSYSIVQYFPLDSIVICSLHSKYRDVHAHAHTHVHTCTHGKRTFANLDSGHTRASLFGCRHELDFVPAGCILVRETDRCFPWRTVWSVLQQVVARPTEEQHEHQINIRGGVGIGVSTD